MKRKNLNIILNGWLIWLVCSSLLADPSFFKLNQTKMNQNPINSENINPIVANIGQLTHLDGYINQTYDFSQKTGEILTIPMTDTQAIEKIEFSLDQINCTNQIINNSIMEKLEETGTSDWGVNSSLGIKDGLSATLDNSSFPNESALQFSIKGNEGSIGFSPFSAPYYNESFYNLENWNLTSNSTNLTLSLYSNSLVPPFESKALKAETGFLSTENQKLYRGNINKSFYYDGTNDISQVKLGFNYQLSYSTNTSIALSVWFIQPNGSQIKFNNWETTQKDSLFRQEFNDLADFETVFQEPGLYYIIFQFDHLFNAYTSAAPTTLILDEINFQMNFTARDVSPFEILYFSQNITHPFIALEDGLLNYNFSLATFPNFINPNEWAFSILLAEFTFDFGTLTAYNVDMWNSSQIIIPKSLLSNRSFILAFCYQYLGTTPLRLNSTMSWAVYFNEIEIWINSGYGWSASQIGLNTTIDTMVGTVWEYSPSTPNPLDPAGIISLYLPKTLWLGNSPPKIQFHSGISCFNLTINGTYKTVSLSWRDYVLFRVHSLYSNLEGYIDIINGWLFSNSLEWGVFAPFLHLLQYISAQDYHSLLYYGYQIRPSFGRIFTSFIAFIDQKYSYSSREFADLLISFSKYDDRGTLEENSQVIKNLLSTVLINQKEKIAEAYAQFRSDIGSININTPPVALKLSAFAQQMALIDQRIAYISEGKASRLVIDKSDVFYPAFDFKLIQALNLQNKWSASLSSLISTCPVQFLESKTIDHSNHLIPAIPLAFYMLDLPSTDLSTRFNVYVQSLTIHDYYLLTLFDLLYTAFYTSENAIGMALKIQNSLQSTSWNNPDYFAADTNFTAGFNNFKPNSASLYAEFEVIPDPEGDDVTMNTGPQQIVQVNGGFAEIQIQIDNIPPEISEIVENNAIFTEIQLYIPDSSTGLLNLLTGFLFEAPFGSSVKFPVPDCLLLQALYQSDYFLRTGQFSLVLNVGYRIGNYVFGVNWTEIIAFELSNIGVKSSDIVLQPDFSNYSEISCPEQFQIHRCDVAWAPIIPNVGVVSIEWLRGQQNECFTSIPLGEISGNNEVNIVDMVRVQQNETINLIFKEFLGLKPLLGQFGTITYHFISLNRLKSVNKILFIHEVLQIKLRDTDGRLIEIEVPLEYRIFPPLTLDNPINSWTIYLIAILIIGLIGLIFIYRLRQRYSSGDLKE